MKIYGKIIAVMLSCLILCSCEGWLKTDPVGNIVADEFYQTPQEVEYALIGVYSGLLPLSEYYWYMGELRADHLWTANAEDSNAQRDYIDIMTYSTNQVLAGTLNSAWLAYYKIISRVNYLLYKMAGTAFEEVAEGDLDIRASFEAEARTLRAFAYFDLVRFFGRVPMVTTPQTVDEAMDTGQSESRDIYEKVIIPDLQFAIDNLGDEACNYKGNAAGTGRVNRIVAQALLGRVYATMAGYPLNDLSKKELALENLKEVVDYAEKEGKYWAKDGLEWQKMWISDYDNRYHIWEIQYTAKENYGNTGVYWMVPKVSAKYIDLQMSGYVIEGRPDFLSLFDTDVDGDGEFDDARRSGTINYDFEDSYADADKKQYITKFFDHKIKRKRLGFTDNLSQIVTRTYFPINFPLVRLEDMMLLYAELAGSSDQEAVRYVNKIRTRAGIGNLTSDEIDDFATAVDHERQRELAGEGIRWHDIVRRGTWQKLMKDKFKSLGSNQYGTVTNAKVYDYNLRVSDGAYLFPIPDPQMKVKDGLYTQNEAYR